MVIVALREASLYEYRDVQNLNLIDVSTAGIGIDHLRKPPEKTISPEKMSSIGQVEN